jgi:hypothetical protein
MVTKYGFLEASEGYLDSLKLEEDFLKDVKKIVIISCSVYYLSRLGRSGGYPLILVRFAILVQKLQFDQNTRNLANLKLGYNRTAKLKLKGQGGK